MMIVRKEKNSNIELLRVIAMFLIVAYHLAIYIDVDLNELNFLNRYVLIFLSLGGKIGVHIFVLITGFYSVNKKEFPTKRIIQLLTRVTIWSVAIQIAYILYSGQSLGDTGLYKGIVLSAIPFFSVKWWFITAYLLLIMISPILNVALQSISKTQFKRYLYWGGVLCCVLPTVSIGKLGYAKSTDPLLLFILIYSLGGYFSRFGCSFNRGKLKFITVTVYSVFFVLVAAQNSFSVFFRDQTSSIFCLVIAVGLFLLFQKATLRSNKVINILGSNTLDIYLLTDHEWIRSILYPFLTLLLVPYQSSLWFIPMFLVIVTILMVIGFILGCIVQKIVLLLTEAEQRLPYFPPKKG